MHFKNLVTGLSAALLAGCSTLPIPELNALSNRSGWSVHALNQENEALHFTVPKTWKIDKHSDERNPLLTLVNDDDGALKSLIVRSQPRKEDSSLSKSLSHLDGLLSRRCDSVNSTDISDGTRQDYSYERRLFACKKSASGDRLYDVQVLSTKNHLYTMIVEQHGAVSDEELLTVTNILASASVDGVPVDSSLTSE